MRSNRPVAWLLILLGTVAGAQTALPEEPTPAPASPPSVAPPPLPAGPAPDLSLVFTAEVAGYVEPCG